MSFSHRDMFPFARRHQAATINAIPARFTELYHPIHDLLGHRHGWAQAHAEIIDEPLSETERGPRIFFHLDAEHVLECVLVCVSRAVSVPGTFLPNAPPVCGRTSSPVDISNIPSHCEIDGLRCFPNAPSLVVVVSRPPHRVIALSVCLA